MPFLPTRLKRSAFRLIPPAERTGRAFTLVEVLVAMSITAMLLLILLQLFNQVTNAWLLETKRESTLRESRSGMRLLADDLQSLHPLPTLPDPLLDAQRQRFILRNPDSLYGSTSFAFLRIARVRRTTSVMPENGDMRLVAYAVAMSKDSGGTVSQKLWRKELDGAATLERVLAHVTLQEPLISEADWNSFVGQDGFIQQAAGDFGRGAEPLVYDLIRFTLTPLEAYADAAMQPALVQTADLYWPANLIPTHVDLRLRVTNRAMGTRLETLADWTGHGKFSDLLGGATRVTHSGTLPSLPSSGAEVRVQTLRLRLMQSNVVPP